MEYKIGKNLKLARLRRKYTKTQVSERAGISRPTLDKIENGISSVTLENYYKVIKVLGLDKEFDNLFYEDYIGRKLQDLELLTIDNYRANCSFNLPSKLELVKDHRFSIHSGRMFNISPIIMRHPFNCEYLTREENLRKKNNNSISLDELFTGIQKYNKVWHEQELCIDEIEKYYKSLK